MENNYIEFLNSAEDQYPAEGVSDRSFSDDGTIHIVRNGVRYCFGIGQDVGRRAFTAEARRIGRAAGCSREEVQRWIDCEFI